MKIRFMVNEEHRFALATWAGSLSDADVLAAYERLYGDERWQPGFDEIVDLRHAELSRITAEGLRALDTLVRDKTGDYCESFKTAVVAPDDLEFGLARMYELLSEESPESVMVFRELDQALAWIGVDASLLKMD